MAGKKEFKETGAGEPKDIEDDEEKDWGGNRFSNERTIRMEAVDRDGPLLKSSQ
jgi:hypothetical protein